MRTASLHHVELPGQPIDYTPANYATTFWEIWFGVLFASFMSFELYQIASGHPENTLSAQVWRLAHVVASQSPTQWAPQHWAFVVVFGLLVAWLTVHFDLGELR